MTPEQANLEFNDRHFARAAVEHGWSLQEARALFALKADAGFFQTQLDRATIAGEPRAVSRLARAYPEEHKAWIAYCNSGAPDLQLIPDDAGGFRSLIRIFRGSGLSGPEAVRAAARRAPEAYKLWRDSGAIVK